MGAMMVVSSRKLGWIFFRFLLFFCVSPHCTACVALLGIGWKTQMTDMWSENSLNHRTNNNHQILPVPLNVKSCHSQIWFWLSFKVVFNFSTMNKSGPRIKLILSGEILARRLIQQRTYKARLHWLSAEHSDDAAKPLQRSPSWQYCALNLLFGCNRVLSRDKLVHLEAAIKVWAD